MFPDDERLFNMSMLVKDDVFYERQRQAYLEKRTRSAPNSSRTYDLPNSSTDALPLNDMRLLAE